MKKNEKIMICVLLLILLLVVGILAFSQTKMQKNIEADVDNKSSILAANSVNNDIAGKDNTPIGRIINVDGMLYYDTGRLSEITLRCGTLDGNVTSIVKENEIPKKDGEANFEGARGYQYVNTNTIEVPTDEGWIIFEAKEKFTIKVYDKTPKVDNKVNKILDKSETDKYDYNVYGYGVNVNVIIDKEEISLRQALLENKITMEEIISKADKDIPNALVYRDGGSKVYKYELYTIIKLNKIIDVQKINKDVYIGMPDFDINDI